MSYEIKDAWSTLQVKSFDNDARTFEGIASTPSTDGEGDIIEPMGATFRLPIAMKWQHGKETVRIGGDQVGEVTHATATPEGVKVKGRFWKVDAPPSLKDDLDRVWSLVKAGMRGLSIGFNVIDAEPIKGTRGMRIKKWRFLELSPVTIPANQDASIKADAACNRCSHSSMSASPSDSIRSAA